MFNRIWKKFTIALLIVSSIPIGYFAYHDLEGEKLSVIDETTRTIFLNTLTRAKDIEMSFRNALTDVNYLRSNLVMQFYNDIEKGEDIQQFWKKMMESEFSIFLSVKPGYSRIGLLDEFGNEIVVVYRVGETIVPMLEEQKKNRVNSTYYVEAAMLDRLGIAAIPLRSEIDPGLDLKSFTLIRYATKIFDSQGKAKGIMYVDLNSVEIFDSLSNTNFKKRRPAGIITGEGNYLYMPFTQERALSQNIRPLNISKDYPEEVLAQILSGAPGIVSAT
jgi:hypothetical protein